MYIILLKLYNLKCCALKILELKVLCTFNCTNEKCYAFLISRIFNRENQRFYLLKIVQ